jgi:hypothetical protein
VPIITNTLTNVEAHATHSRQGKANGRPTLRARRGYKGHQLGPYSNPLAPAPVSTSATANEAMLRLIGNAWKNTLSGAQQAGWSALALVQPITNNDGTTQFVTGLQFFTWYNKTAGGLSRDIHNFMIWTDVDLTQNAPAPWDAPATPAGPNTFTYLGPFRIRFHVTTTPFTALSGITMLTMNPSPRVLPSALPSTHVIPFSTAQTSDPAGDVIVDVVTWINTIGNDWLAGKRAILRLFSGAPNATPSAPLLFTMP